MNIITVRRISQIFFFVLFLWFCIVSSFGEKWWQLRGWPVNWFLQLDPLVALGTILTTTNALRRAGLGASDDGADRLCLAGFSAAGFARSERFTSSSAGSGDEKRSSPSASRPTNTDRHRPSSITCSSDCSPQRPATCSPIFSMWRGNGR